MVPRHLLNSLLRLPPSDIQLESQETAYNAYKFYKVLEERTSFSHTLVEDVKVTPDLAEMMAQIWRDAGIQSAYLRFSIKLFQTVKAMSICRYRTGSITIQLKL